MALRLSEKVSRWAAHPLEKLATPLDTAVYLRIDFRPSHELLPPITRAEIAAIPCSVETHQLRRTTRGAVLALSEGVDKRAVLWKSKERLCDLAAAEMLLPRRFFVADLADVGLPDLDSVEELARAYCASHEATTRRTVDLAAHPIGMMVFHFGHKPDDRGHEHVRDSKVRLEYAYSDGNLPFPLRHKSAAKDSAFHRAWEYELVDEISDVDDYFADQVGPARVSARRYGDKVIALVQPVRPGES